MRSLSQIAAEFEEKASRGLCGIASPEETKMLARALRLLPSISRYAFRMCHDGGHPTDRENAAAIIRLIEGLGESAAPFTSREGDQKERTK